MKDIIISIVITIVSYLVGAFYNASFDLSYWSESSRYFTLLIWFLVLIGYYGFNYLGGKYE